MNLFILRHGIAEDVPERDSWKDADRALTEEGELKLKGIAKALDALGLSFDLVLSSPYTRAQQTAEIIVHHMKPSRAVELTENLAPSGSTKKLVELLGHCRPKPEQVLLVGHEPYLSEFISLLVFGDSAGLVEMKKGGVCKLSTESLRHGRCATLEWLLTPKQMLLMR